MYVMIWRRRTIWLLHPSTASGRPLFKGSHEEKRGGTQTEGAFEVNAVRPVNLRAGAQFLDKPKLFHGESTRMPKKHIPNVGNTTLADIKLGEFKTRTNLRIPGERST